MERLVKIARGNTTIELISPTVHLNGDSYETLFGHYEEINKALYATENRMHEAAPHGRNYEARVPGPDYARARAEFQDRLRRVRELREEIGAIMLDVYAQRPKSRLARQMEEEPEQCFRKGI